LNHEAPKSRRKITLRSSSACGMVVAAAVATCWLVFLVARLCGEFLE
jgi:hypothetical protein